MMDSSPEEEAPVRITREAPKRGACVAAFPLGFSRDWEIYRDEARKRPLGRRKAGMRMHTGPHRSEFPPAIPRRVASQQSPLPLRQIFALNQLPTDSRQACS